MPREPAVHFNPDETEKRFRGRTRCGFQLAKVQHSTNPEHVSCDRCLACIEADAR